VIAIDILIIHGLTTRASTAQPDIDAPYVRPDDGADRPPIMQR
jgi:hypothetical protein